MRLTMEPRSSFSSMAMSDPLYNAGHLSEMESYLHWMVKVIHQSASELQILYGLRKGAILIEEELTHLEGYKGSSPVRIGNGAYDQKQLDIYGEIMDTALRLSNYVGKIDQTLWPSLQNICDTVVREWQHGILRSNQRLPHSVYKSFARSDPRLRFVIEDLEPRIHFALVCASSSCPPLDIYTAENLDAELTVSGKTFLNDGGIQVDQDEACVRLSRVFKWYGEDFGNNEADRLRFIAPYLYDEKNKLFLKEKADSVQVEYQSYDWRLNRT